MFWIYLFMFIGYNLVIIQGQSDSIGWQSFLSLSGFGMQFSPVDEQALFLSGSNVDLIEACAQTCQENIFCRIFDFNSQPNLCRLFQGDANTMGSIIASSSSLSVVGSVELVSEQFSSRGLPCSYCLYSPHLTCINSTCQCPSGTYFDGSICQSQNLLGGQCINEMDCRIDLNFTCLPRQQCGPLSLQYGVTVGGYSNETAGNASDALSKPFGIIVGNDGSLYVGDTQNARVIHLPVGSLIGTVVAGTGTVGNGSNQLNYPSNLYVDAASNVYVSDTRNGRAMLWPNGSSTGTSVTSTTLLPTRVIGIVVDSQKNVYIAETDMHIVTKWAPNATNGTIVAGIKNVLGTDNQHLAYPFGLYLDELNSYLYVADFGNNRIQRFTLGVSMNGTTVAGGNGNGSANNQLYFPQGLRVSKETGTIYIADTYNNRVTRWNPGATNGVTIAGIGGIYGTNATLLYGSSDVALSPNETYLYVTDLNNNRIQPFQLI